MLPWDTTSSRQPACVSGPREGAKFNQSRKDSKPNLHCSPLPGYPGKLVWHKQGHLWCVIQIIRDAPTFLFSPEHSLHLISPTAPPLLIHSVTALNKKSHFLQFPYNSSSFPEPRLIAPLHFSFLTDSTLLLSAFLSDGTWRAPLSLLTCVKCALCYVGPTGTQKICFLFSAFSWCHQ